MSWFDNLDDQNPDINSIKPYHTVETTEKAQLKWLNEVYEVLSKQATMRTTTQREHLAIYKGTPFITKRSNNRDSDNLYRSSRVEKFVVNHLYDMVETKVAQMMRVKPAIDVMPTNSEFEDRNAAKATKLLIDHLWYINDVDHITEKIHRYTRIFGEAFLFITWNPNKGDLDPNYVKARDAGEKLHLTNKEGVLIYDENGQPVEIKNPVYTGDVEYDVPAPWRVLLQRKRQIEDVEYVIKVSIESVEDLKKRYPKKKNDITADKDLKVFDPERMGDRSLEEETVVMEFFHKKTDLLSKGKYIKFTKSAILESSELPYSHGELPFERLTDLDMPEQLNGCSRLELIRSIQNMHNNINTLIAKNIYLTGHAKWVMPRGACKIEQLGNDNTVIQYKGPVAPQMVHTQPNTPEVYNYRESLKDDMGTIYGVHGVSRGTPPNGVTAAVALQFLNEQESERASTDIVKHNNFIKNIAKKTLSVAGDYYLPDDGRMIRIVGKDNEHMIKYFDSANLSKSYDVRVQGGNALPESKAGRMQRIIELIQYKPDLLSPERLIELLDFGDTEKFTTLITEAVRSADSENQDLMQGNLVGEPEEWEDHIIHWRAHTKLIQKRSFKEETPLEIQQAVIDHITDTEFAMTEKAKENPLFQAKVAELALFPIFYRDGFVPQSREQSEAIVSGQANRGEQITGQIPTQEPTAFPEEQTREEKK